MLVKDIAEKTTLEKSTVIKHIRHLLDYEPDEVTGYDIDYKEYVNLYNPPLDINSRYITKRNIYKQLLGNKKRLYDEVKNIKSYRLNRVELYNIDDIDFNKLRKVVKKQKDIEITEKQKIKFLLLKLKSEFNFNNEWDRLAYAIIERCFLDIILEPNNKAYNNINSRFNAIYAETTRKKNKNEAISYILSEDNFLLERCGINIKWIHKLIKDLDINMNKEY